MRSGEKNWAFMLLVMAALVFAVAPRASAQNDGSITGTILDVTGKPWADIPVRFESDQGAKQETKTDSKGNYGFHNLRSGIYKVFITLPAPNQPYEIPVQVTAGGEAKGSVNFKDVVGKQGADYQEKVKKQEEDKNKFESMKTHFAAGNTLLEQERAAKADLTKATPDQRDAGKQKLNDIADKTVAEFKDAQKAAGEKDANLHLILAKLGEAYDVAGRNDEAADAYRQAIAAKPESQGYYNNLGNVLARAGKIDEAKAAYTKSAELDPPNAATAWRNFGISLYNANRLPDAVEPLKKAAELDPKSAQTWYLLGASLVSTMGTKQVGGKLEVQLAPGTVEAYQKAVELDPNGTYGKQAQEGLVMLQQIIPGIDTKVNTKKKK